MAKSKTKISKQLKKKTNFQLVETIISAKKNNAWLKIAEILAGPRKNRTNFNLNELNNKTKENDKVIIIGKVLSQGEINKKIKIIAFNFSNKAKEKLLSAKCEVSNMLEEIKKNPDAKGFKILKK
jgi:large subunit ribosomal protein L18e